MYKENDDNQIELDDFYLPFVNSEKEHAKKNEKIGNS